MSIVILGIDLGKNSCSIVGVDAAGAVVVRRSMRCQTLIDYVTKLPACVVRWRRAAAPIIWVACLSRRGTRSG
jgi:hypothetical protein